MSSHSKSRLARVLTMLPAMIAVLCTFGTLAAAQDQPAPKWELYGGYSFFNPGADIHGQLPGALLPLNSRLEVNPRGAGASVTYNFNSWFGLTLDTSTHWGSGEKTIQKRIDDAGASNLSFGPKLTLRRKHFSPFLELLLGDQRLMPDAFHDIDKLGLMLGGGLDINLSKHVALRLLRADYVHSNYRYGLSTVTSTTHVRGLRLQTGLNFMFGGGEPAMSPGAACSLQPTEVFAGEPVTVTANGSNFNPRRTVKYNWNGTGVKVGGSDASTQIDTTGLQPGSYGVTANLSDGSKNGFASCSARFTVKAPRPPVISCSAHPPSVRTGGTSTINSNASSPDGRRLMYSYTASAGEISGNGDTATLDTRGAQPGSITVSCNVGDDRNPPLTASSTTFVNVEAPPPPPSAPSPTPEMRQLEAKLALHSIYFPTAQPKEDNPNGGLVASQQKVLTSLADDFKKYLALSPDSHLTLGGHADVRGSIEYNKALTERRVGRTKSFLVEHGVPSGSLETQSFGKQQNLSSDEVRQLIEENPDLSTAERQKLLGNLPVIVLANNRRVDVTLSTTGQQSVRQYPFNARDSLTLLSTQGGTNLKGTKPAAKKPAAKKPAAKKPATKKP